ncbi:hypothetical protein OOJ09_22120 [Mesorhizobium qingshengii]|uniref:Uncharacterized protein n=1 Tax=Mesorhizobium qingshengii TaxID=1165689 RepID=A0ABT4QZ94_9HYPH|nr:hypothetical protein [Mesorhizobium qingshengii]MCZ8546892.1 hypothetical protein [Mesorhizobium qingshengii]
MAKALTIGAPQHPAMTAAYEQECRDMLVPHLDAVLDKAEAAGWDRGQAASALMYLAAMRLKPA